MQWLLCKQQQSAGTLCFLSIIFDWLLVCIYKQSITDDLFIRKILYRPPRKYPNTLILPSDWTDWLADRDNWELLMIWLYFRRENSKIRACSFKGFSSIIMELSRINWLLQKMMVHNNDITFDYHSIIIWFDKKSQIRILVGQI